MERVNVDGTERVARACAALGVGLLFPSTTSVYGVPHGVVTEDCPPEDLRPQSPYAGWKLQSEELLGSLAGQEGLRFVIFRMGTIFGPSVGMRFHTAVNQFCWRAVAGQPIEVWQTASHQFRPYLDLYRCRARDDLHDAAAASSTARLQRADAQRDRRARRRCAVGLRPDAHHLRRFAADEPPVVLRRQQPFLRNWDSSFAAASSAASATRSRCSRAQSGTPRSTLISVIALEQPATGRRLFRRVRDRRMRAHREFTDNRRPPRSTVP